MKNFNTTFNTCFLSFILATITPCGWAQRPLKRKVTFPLDALAIQLDSAPTNTNNNSAPPITIWIHGSRLFPRTVFKSFFDNKPQLKLARDLDKRYYLRQIADTFIAHDQQQFSYETFYLLGWSGKISFTARQEAAHVLYDQLKKVCSDYKIRYGKEPHVRIITHSHGGNVALNLVREKQKYDANTALRITELILLACPVQIKTQNYVHDSLFEKVYALYSSLDFLQVIDPQGLYPSSKNTPLFSQRCFPNNEKLTQVKIQVNNRAITHAEFVMPKFVCYLPDIIQEIALWRLETPSLAPSLEPIRLLCITTK